MPSALAQLARDGMRRRSAARQFHRGTFRHQTTSLGGCVQFRITKKKQFLDRVIVPGHPRVWMGGLTVSDQTQPGEERSHDECDGE
jgi:hypothetical protein